MAVVYWSKDAIKISLERKENINFLSIVNVQLSNIESRFFSVKKCKLTFTLKQKINRNNLEVVT